MIGKILVFLLVCFAIIWYGYDSYRAGTVIFQPTVDKVVIPLFKAYDYGLVKYQTWRMTRENSTTTTLQTT